MFHGRLASYAMILFFFNRACPASYPHTRKELRKQIQICQITVKDLIFRSSHGQNVFRLFHVRGRFPSLEAKRK